VRPVHHDPRIEQHGLEAQDDLADEVVLLLLGGGASGGGAWASTSSSRTS